jgi:2-polyprenyl-3-methyl-5-hydroxy-6-metoxy-1,4-benzoquinol methylase
VTSRGVNDWDAHAEAYGRYVARREEAGLEHDQILVRLFEALGDVAGRAVLDACCGGGFLSRLLAARGARVTGIDIGPRLIAMAREQDPDGRIDYRLHDLSQPIPELEGRFDCIASYLALNDVPDHRGFAATVASLAKPGARIALAFNNPYSFLVRGEGHITDYFENGARGAYGGMAAAGVPARYYHRTLEEYMDAFIAAGLRLVKLADVPDRGGLIRMLPEGGRFPRFMVLVFEKSGA